MNVHPNVNGPGSPNTSSTTIRYVVDFVMLNAMRTCAQRPFGCDGDRRERADRGPGEHGDRAEEDGVLARVDGERAVRRAVYEYQTEWVAGNPWLSGSPGCAVASSVVPLTDPCVPLIVAACSKLSFAGAPAAAAFGSAASSLRGERDHGRCGPGASERAFIDSASVGRRSALDHVVDERAENHRLVQLDAMAREDRQERRSECVELLLGVPDIEHLDLAVGLECDVV